MRELRSYVRREMGDFADDVEVEYDDDDDDK
jgi:hypothetical protein